MADTKTFTLKIDGTEKIFHDLTELQAHIKKTGKTEAEFFKTVQVTSRAADKETRAFISNYKSGLGQLTKSFSSIGEKAKEFGDKLEESVSGAVNAIGKISESTKKMAQQFGVGQEASEQLSATFEKLQILSTIAEGAKGATTAFFGLAKAARAVYVALGPIGFALAAIAVVIAVVAAAFAFFGKGAKQIRQENLDSVKSNKDLADSFRDLEQIDFEQTTSKIVANNKKRISSAESLIRLQKEQLVADFNFTKEELAIYESGNADLIEELARTEEIQLKLRAEGAQDALTVLTDNSKKIIEIQRDTENQLLKLKLANITSTTALNSSLLEASADYSAKTKNIAINTVKDVATIVLGLDKSTRDVLAQVGIEFDNFQTKTLKSLQQDADVLKRALEANFNNSTAATQVKILYNQIETAIVQANNQIAALDRQQRINKLKDDTAFFKERTSLIDTFNIKSLNLEKDIDNQLKVLYIQRGKDIDTAETDRQIRIVKAARENSRILLIEEENEALTALYKQRLEITNTFLQRQLDLSNFYSSLDIDLQESQIEKQGENQKIALAEETKNIFNAFKTRKNILQSLLDENLITQDSFNQSSIEANEKYNNAIADSNEKRDKITQETNMKVYAQRLVFINKTIEAIQRQLTEETRLRAIENTKNQLASDEDIINVAQLTKRTTEYNAALVQSGFNFGKINTNYAILSASAKVAAQAQTDAIKLVIAEQVKLLENQNKIDKENEKQLEALKILNGKLSGEDAKKLVDAQNRLKTFEKEKANLLKKGANDLLKAENDLSNSLKDINAKRIADIVASLKTGLDAITSLFTSFSTVFNSYVTEANKQVQMQIDENQKRLDNVNANIAVIDERIAATNAELTNLLALSNQADSGRRDAIIAQIHNEEAARNNLIDIKKKEIVEAKKIEADNKRLAAEQKIREEQSANIALASATIQSFANAAVAISEISIKASQNPANAIDFGISAIAQIVAVTAAVLGNITTVLAKTGTVKFAKGGILEGPSHAQGGIALSNSRGASYGEAEGGEVILTKNVSRNPALLSVASNINQIAGGNSLTANSRFADGGILPNLTAFQGVDSKLTGLLDTAMNLSERPIIVSVTDINLTNQRLSVIENKATI